MSVSVKRGKLASRSAALAARWMTRQLLTLVSIFLKHGRRVAGEDSVCEITFGVLYEKTIDVFEVC